MAYIFDNAAAHHAAPRFESLQSLHDPHTIALLDRIGVAPGWHCLEVGGGRGSIGVWLADRVGANGSVFVTDIDPRFVAPACPNLTVLRHDVATDPLPAGAFDLIHARLVFIHVPEPWPAIARLCGALKPGGWIVIEDYDPGLIDRALPTASEADAALVRVVFAAIRKLMQKRGLDVRLARDLYRGFVAIGLEDVAMEGHVAVRPGGSAGAELDRSNLAQIAEEAVAAGLLAVNDIVRMTSLLASSDSAVLSPVLFSAGGRRPRQAAPDFPRRPSLAPV